MILFKNPHLWKVIDYLDQIPQLLILNSNDHVIFLKMCSLIQHQFYRQ